MSKHFSHLNLTALALAAALCGASPAWSQVAGGTSTPDASMTEMTQLAMGWSVKNTLMGKSIYSDAGQEVGKVDDLIIAPDKSLTYVIVGAGGFVGIGRHDVAIPVAMIQEQAGKLIMAGATKSMIKAMPEFHYATDTDKRDKFVAAAEGDIAKGKAKLNELEKSAGEATTDAKAKIDLQISALQTDLQSAESKLGELKQATAMRWKEFESGVGAATARVRKSIDAATG